MNARPVVLLVLSLLPAACASFTTPRPQTLAKLQPMPLAALLPGRFELELTSPGLTGTFDGACGVDGQSFRVQLFPDVGGKVLDVTVGAAAVVAELPGHRYEAPAPLDRAEPHLALVFAVLFGELLAPLPAVRVLGERAASGGTVEVQLRPCLGSGCVTARLAADGTVEQYEFVLGALAFTLAADGTFQGRGFAGRIRAAGG